MAETTGGIAYHSIVAIATAVLAFLERPLHLTPSWFCIGSRPPSALPTWMERLPEEIPYELEMPSIAEPAGALCETADRTLRLARLRLRFDATPLR